MSAQLDLDNFMSAACVNAQSKKDQPDNRITLFIRSIFIMIHIVRINIKKKIRFLWYYHTKQMSLSGTCLVTDIIEE